ncbi:MAG: hypothetical protein GF307_03935 [candidate division Zixibacteria bacterium]|nr:hypothetical protein [candidate division Zixibacteria bacterium]
MDDPPDFENEYCQMCHSDPEMVAESGDTVYVNEKVLNNSVHGGFSCVDCHAQPEADFEDIPHYADYQGVQCNHCHPRTSMVYMEFFYGMLEKRGHEDIPDCVSCHGGHDTQKRMSMEIVCDRCHHKQAEDYKQSYHFQKYKEDPRQYPICTTCHDPHFKSKKQVMSTKEYRQEIVDICARCHQRDIETYIHSRHYHEFEAGNLDAPVCTSCHETHAIRHPSNPNSKVNDLNIADVCNGCHPGHKESMHVQPGTEPNARSCAACHTGHQTDMASINNRIFKEGGIFNQCSICHSEERHAKEHLAHGQTMLIDPKSGEQANCTQCHIYHYKLHGEDSVRTAASKVDCVNCHGEVNRAYKNSIHWKARAEGFEEAPYCTDCHGEANILKTSEQFTAEGIIDLCASCHSNREMMLGFRINPYVVEGYKDTYHGKIFETGTQEVKFAVCTNCHGSHSVLPPEDPESSVNRAHIVETCKQCHPRANDRFVSYLVHPKKASPEEYEAVPKAEPGEPLAAGESIKETERPIPQDKSGGWRSFNNLVAAAMTALLIGVLGVFGFHTILWFQRGFRGRFKREKVVYYRRFNGFNRFLHVLVNVSFLLLAFTGLPQSYAHTDLAKWMFEHIISLQTAKYLHYVGAVITGIYFLLHLIYLAFKLRKNGIKSMLTGPDTMMFRKKDFTDFIQHVKWFFGKGEMPRFDRWTYWEKFDYFAVFWGVFVIGLSGLLRWFDEFFGSLLGGGVITLADTIHKEEALLATAFIFMIHFFNTHLRIEKFPMDVSIYSGRISEKEFEEERPEQYERLKREGKLDNIKVKSQNIFMAFLSYLWGTAALLVGLFLLGLIIIGHLTGH